MREKELIIFREFGTDAALLRKVSHMMALAEKDKEGARREELTERFFDCASELFKMAGTHGFYGNLWHCFLSYLLVNNENPFSHSCEIRGAVDGTVNACVLHDMEIFRELFACDFRVLSSVVPAELVQAVLSYEGNAQESRVYNSRIRDRICVLAQNLAQDETAAAMKDTLTQFYKEYGVGRFGLHKAFRITTPEYRAKTGELIEPILNIAHVQLSDLVGYETAKQLLVENTEAFLDGKKANNCILYGDAGTGKSTSIKALANEYYERGLRIIEVYKHQFKDLNDVIALIKNRNYKFIIYMDDLSFEDFEIEYKYLKAVIEGGLEKKPANVLIYATSNRRHLVREKFSDKPDILDDDLHRNDTVQEKLSLAARFGVNIYFGKPDKKHFQEIVRVLAERNGIQLPEDELMLAANKWELQHGGMTGRTAQQFIDHLLGTME